MTARATLNLAVVTVQVAAAGLLLLGRVPLWAAIALASVIISGIAATTRQGILPDGGADFLLLRLWDVFWLWRGGDSLAGAWRQCFGGQRAQPPP
jgi:hypothetical protein